MKIKIIEAKNQHIDFIVNSQLKMALETENLKLDYDTVFNGVSSVVTRKELGTYYVGLVDDELASCLFTTYEWSDWRSKGVLWIQSVYVSEDFRKQGLYSKMYEHIKSIVASDKDLAGIRLYVDKTNHNAIKVYQRLGMSAEHYELYEWMP